MRSYRFLLYTNSVLLFAALIFGACSPDQANLPAPSEYISVVEVKETAPPEEEIRTPEPEADILSYSEYTIILDVNPETNVVKGNQKILYTNKTGTALDEIYFNLHLNAFTQGASYQPYFSDFSEKIFKNGRDYAFFDLSSAVIEGEITPYTLQDTVLRIPLPQTLAVNGTVEITLIYEAYIPTINHRTGSNNYAIWLGNFLPVLAVYENGGWRTDEYYAAGDPFYSETANYNVTVNTPTDFRVVSTGVETSKEDKETNTRTTTIVANMVRDFTLAVLDNSYIKTSISNKDGIEINMYFRSNISNLNSYIKAVEQSLNFFSETIGNYPYEQLDVVETGFFFSGGMEYSQIIFIDGDYLQQPGSINTLAHEVGHQWFYNIIGSDQINNAWMDEGLTSMLQEYIFSEDENSIHREFVSAHQRLESQLTSANAYMLTDDLSNFKSWSDYYNTHYVKGKLMCYSLRMKMGEENFQAFLQTYYDRFSFKIAGLEDFMATAEEFYGDSLTEFFDAWLYGVDLPPLYS